MELSIDGKPVSLSGGMTFRRHPATISYRSLDAKTGHLFSDPLRLSLNNDTFHLSKGKHTLRVSWQGNRSQFDKVLLDKVHLTNDPAFRPKAYDPFVRPLLKGRGW